MSSDIVEIDNEGKIKLPSNVLVELGLKPKSRVYVTIKNNGLFLTKFRERERDEFIESFCGAIEAATDEDLDLKQIWHMK